MPSKFGFETEQDREERRLQVEKEDREYQDRIFRIRKALLDHVRVVVSTKVTAIIIDYLTSVGCTDCTTHPGLDDQDWGAEGQIEHPYMRVWTDRLGREYRYFREGHSIAIGLKLPNVVCATRRIVTSTLFTTCMVTRSGLVISPPVDRSDYRLYVRYVCAYDGGGWFIPMERRDIPPELARVLRDQTGIEVVPEWSEWS